MPRILLTTLFELALLVLAIFAADSLQQHISFIPSAIVQLPEIDYSVADRNVVLWYFLVIYALVFLVSNLASGGWRCADSHSSVKALYVSAVGFALAALLVFTTTSINFDPNFMVGIVLLLALFMAVVHLLASRGGSLPLWRRVFDLLSGLLRKAFTLSGALSLLIALSPAVLAKLFVSNRDVANTITQIRLFFNQEAGGEYQLVNLFGDLKFAQPMLVRVAPGNPGLIYVLERAGKIKSVGTGAQSGVTTLLDITARVGVAEVENGALGFAFHPEFGLPGSENENSVYLYYTSVEGDRQTNILSLFTLDADAAGQTEQVLLSLPRENSGFHNGGSVEFGPDGFLYVALGEGVHPQGLTSQAETLRAGILRLDVLNQGAPVSRPSSNALAQGLSQGYMIPLDNPFLDSASLMDEYWALGLRNPFRISFDPLTGNLWAGDVGSTKWEEVNLVRKGLDYQFPYIEGEEATGMERTTPASVPEQGPVYTYLHTAYDRAVIGGIVYHGADFPELDGKYLFADSYSAKVFSLDTAANTPASPEVIATADQFAQRGVSSLTQLPSGDVVVTTLGRSGAASGEVLVLRADSGAGDDDRAQVAAAPVYSADEIRGIYVSNCARCHGLAGDGQGPDAPAFKLAMPDFSDPDYARRTSPQSVGDIIRRGGYAVGKSPYMPAWEALMSEQEIDLMVGYLLEMSAQPAHAE